MSEIKAKIVAVMPKQREFNGTKGTFYIHGIVYEGSSEVWEYTSDKPTCEDFVQGQEATFTIETGTNAKGYPIKKIKPVKANSGGGGKNFGGGKSFQKSPETEALIVLQSCFAAVCNLNAQSSTRDIKSIIIDTNTAFEWMMKKAKAHVEKGATTAQPVQQPAAPQQPAAVSTPAPVAPPAQPITQPEEDDDLPF